MSSMIYRHENPLRQAIVRGLMGRCPHCGEGKLFRAYLKPVESCASCGEPLGHIRADDGPAWLTVMVVGHATVATVLMFGSVIAAPLWLSLPVIVGLSSGLVMVTLPRAKGAFINAIWEMGAPGSEPISVSRPAPLADL
jgi:uncharacterized protein (DUF983 family)